MPESGDGFQLLAALLGIGLRCGHTKAAGVCLRRVDRHPEKVQEARIIGEPRGSVNERLSVEILCVPDYSSQLSEVRKILFPINSGQGSPYRARLGYAEVFFCVDSDSLDRQSRCFFPVYS